MNEWLCHISQFHLTDFNFGEFSKKKRKKHGKKTTAFIVHEIYFIHTMGVLIDLTNLWRW